MILASHLAEAVDQLAPPDRPLMLHVSLRSFGAPIAGGADTLLDVLLRRGRTVMVPAFTEPHFSLAPPAAVTMRPGRNGIDYTTFPAVPPPFPGSHLLSPRSHLLSPRSRLLSPRSRLPPPPRPAAPSTPSAAGSSTPVLARFQRS